MKTPQDEFQEIRRRLTDAINSELADIFAGEWKTTIGLTVIAEGMGIEVFIISESRRIDI